MFNQNKTYFLIVFLIAIFFIFNVGNSFAEISKEYDDFKEKTSYFSEFTSACHTWDFLMMSLSKKDNKFGEQSLGFVLKEDDWHFFTHKNLEMKIDGKITEVEFVAQKTDMIDANVLMTAGFFSLTDDNLKRIKNADDITMRIYMRNVQDITWEIPDMVLNEWQKLIERSGVLK